MVQLNPMYFLCGSPHIRNKEDNYADVYELKTDENENANSFFIHTYYEANYDAFDNMAGELSYSLALLNADNSGFVITSMHSKQGCYSYAKEIIKGESYLALSKEEKAAIGKALTVDEEIEKMKTETEEEDIM